MQTVINLNPQQRALVAAHPGRAVIILSPDTGEWGFNVLSFFPTDDDFMYIEVPVCAESLELSIPVGDGGIRTCDQGLMSALVSEETAK
jgi:hypothetical protein